LKGIGEVIEDVKEMIGDDEATIPSYSLSTSK
jgi:hypothetical protein